MTSQLERAVQVMDRLRSPGGCPWDAAQTHESLTRYLLEETYEVIEAIETGDLALLREELGDLLLQVLFHARLAEELPDDERFDIEDVAGALAGKLISRHPHVFGDMQVASVEEQTELWEELKVAEKGRTSAVDGVPLAQPALALTAKLISRAQRAGLGDLADLASLADPRSLADLASLADLGSLTDPGGPADALASGESRPRVATNSSPLGRSGRHSAQDVAEDGQAEDVEREIGARLLAVVRDAVAAGVDPEAALRRTARAYRAAITSAERS
ncbi:MazG family protein [Jatrophihabitans cynanchi]|uniref:MazG family protein n=1 Tax=Jatrophihabitans cynanchi TaxID=2944128 RepID=A0ABY7JX85_9ACTN|nr:MazG family protein [Jatrophihabitans sp. SB3-54]WAX55922.1 MazG family protein [Jatrophihabitans sp. SB3-54]